MGLCAAHSTFLSTFSYLSDAAAAAAAVKSLQSCPTLSDPMGCSLPGSSVHGIFQARVLEWAAIAFSYLSDEARANTQTWLECGRNRIQTQGSSSCSLKGLEKGLGCILRERSCFRPAPTWEPSVWAAMGSKVPGTEQGDWGLRRRLGCSVSPRNQVILPETFHPWIL